MPRAPARRSTPRNAANVVSLPLRDVGISVRNRQRISQKVQRLEHDANANNAYSRILFIRGSHFNVSARLSAEKVCQNSEYKCFVQKKKKKIPLDVKHF